jgi:hypothetical protein
MLRLMICLAAITGAVVTKASPATAADTVKVFVLAGQSNMEGKAPNQLFDHQATDAKTKDFFAHLRDGDKWVERDDVFIKYLDRHGPLTLGYGSRSRTGAEFQFGYVMGEHFDEPVILIKAAWGGHSLYKLFRSPSNPPSQERLDKELEDAIKRTKAQNEKKGTTNPLPTMEDIKKDYGNSYRNMMAEIEDVKENYGTLFPALKGKKLEFTGFFWFQGWNDMYNGAEQEYADNMTHFIKDVRKDLNAPNLPFVIAVMGQNGSKESSGNMKVVQEAQLAMENVPEFKGNVKAVRTDVLVDKAAEELYPKWRENFEEWQRTGGDFGYHYMGSAIWFTRIGNECGEAMLELMGKK